MLRHWHILLLGMAFALSLSGCETVGSELFTEESALVCPRTDVIEQASSYTAFRPDLPGDVNGVRYNVHFVGLSGECALDKTGVLRLDLYLLFLAETGLSLETGIQAEAPWFVVLLREDGAHQEILARRVFTQVAALQQDGDLVPIREHLTITLAGQSANSLAGLRVYGGFVLDDQQWDFNEQYPFYFR